jgi:hypothetical protein
MLFILLVICAVGFFLWGEGIYVVHLVSYLCCGFFVGGGSMLLILLVFCVVFLVLFVFVLCIVPNVSCVS